MDWFFDVLLRRRRRRHRCHDPVLRSLFLATFVLCLLTGGLEGQLALRRPVLGGGGSRLGRLAAAGSARSSAGGRQCVCNLKFRPVCGRDGQTYPNACTAACKEQVIACTQACPCTSNDDESPDGAGTGTGTGNGTGTETGTGTNSDDDDFVFETEALEVEDDYGGDDDDDDSAVVTEDDEDIEDDGNGPLMQPDCVCSQHHQPVCARDGKTYSNQCLANCARARVACRGRCPCSSQDHWPPLAPPAPPPQQQNDFCICSDSYLPVCGRNGETYMNECFARCKRVGVRCRGRCPCPWNA